MNLQKLKTAPVPLDPVGRGMTRQLRGLKPCNTIKGQLTGEFIELAKEKQHSVYELARKAGIKVTVRSTGDGMIRVWRLPE